jgi:succinate-acetate transporter protein
MPASDSAMSSPMGGSDSSKMGGGMASASILGFLAFGMTAILFGLSQLPKPYANGFVGYSGVTGTDIALGGLVLGIVGIILLLQNHLYWGIGFLGFAAFWFTTSASFTTGTLLGGGPIAYGAAGFAFIWLLFTLTLLLSSMKHGWGSFFFLLFLLIGFILLIIEAWTAGGGFTKISSGEHWAVGGEWIFLGLVAWYSGTAHLTQHSYGKRVLPI